MREIGDDTERSDLCNFAHWPPVEASAKATSQGAGVSRTSGLARGAGCSASGWEQLHSGRCHSVGLVVHLLRLAGAPLG